MRKKKYQLIANRKQQIQLNVKCAFVFATATTKEEKTNDRKKKKNYDRIEKESHGFAKSWSTLLTIGWMTVVTRWLVDGNSVP